MFVTKKGKVAVDGYRAVNKKLAITADAKVAMTNSGDSSTRDLAVTFECVSKSGFNFSEILRIGLIYIDLV